MLKANDTLNHNWYISLSKQIVHNLKWSRCIKLVWNTFVIVVFPCTRAIASALKSLLFRCYDDVVSVVVVFMSFSSQFCRVSFAFFCFISLSPLCFNIVQYLRLRARIVTWDFYFSFYTTMVFFFCSCKIVLLLFKALINLVLALLEIFLMATSNAANEW